MHKENGGFHFSGKECALHKCEFNSPDIKLKKGKQDGNTMLGVIIITGILTHGFHRLLSKMKHNIDIHEYTEGRYANTHWQEIHK